MIAKRKGFAVNASHITAQEKNYLRVTSQRKKKRVMTEALITI